MGEIFFTKEEKDFVGSVIEHGLFQRRGQNSPQWWVMRLALAKSLRLGGFPGEDEFHSPGAVKEGSELHLKQITGEETDSDYTDAIRFVLSVKHGNDYFADRQSFIDALQRHLRRGLKELAHSWQKGFDFHDYLLNDLYFDPQAIAVGQTTSEHTGVLTLERLKTGLAQIQVNADIDPAPHEGPRLTRFTLTLATVDDYDRLRKGLEELAFTTGLGTRAVTMAHGRGERRVILDVPRPNATWKDVTWSAVRSALDNHPASLPVCPGTDVLGAPFVFDLAEAPHLIVAGTTGSGKSVCLETIILSLLAAARPPELVLIDPKQMDFLQFEGCRRLREGRVLTDMTEAVAVLRGLVDEMEQRQSDLRALGARTLAEAQAKGSALERVVVMVDELADLLQQRVGADEPLVRLAQKARAVGIHLVLATQRPEAATLPGLLRSNVPSRIALTVQKSADSRIILDETGAETLLMRGDMLIRLAGRETVRAHGARVQPVDISAALSARN